MRLVAGNRYLYCYGVGEGGVLAVEGRLTVGRLGGWTSIKCLKRGWIVKKCGECKVAGALKNGDCDPFTNCAYMKLQFYEELCSF